jgi:hypothetical protein
VLLTTPLPACLPARPPTCLSAVRPDFWYDSALIFLLQALRVEELGGNGELQALPEDALPHL